MPQATHNSIADQQPVLPERPQVETRWMALLVVLKLMMQFAAAGRYGYFRDELYYIDCARHLAWGYVDQAPLIALLVRIELFFGESLRILRFLPAIAGAGLVVLAMVVARELGGRRYAQVLAGLCIIVAPIYMVLHYLMTMNAFEPLFWMGAVLCVLRVQHGANEKLWLLFGALIGLGIENKHSTVFFAFALATALLATGAWRLFRSTWLWVGVALAFALALPNFIWQVHYHFPTYELLMNVAKSDKNVSVGFGGFFLQQLQIMNPLTAIAWLAGLIWLLFARAARGLRWMAVLYVLMFAFFVVAKGKYYYLAPMYGCIFAAGAVAVERGLRDRATWLKPFYVMLLLASGALLAPAMLPFLSPERYITYTETMHLAPPKAETHHVGPLPQPLGDQFGWPEMVEKIAALYNSLPAEERAKTGIFGQNYGEASAIDFFGKQYGLPPVISGHQTFWYWGTHGQNPENLIVTQDEPESLAKWCDSVEVHGEVSNPYAMAEEHWPLLLCRGFKYKMDDVWPRMKKWR